MADTTKRVLVFREAIGRFLKGRLDAKLDKLVPDDPVRSDLIGQHRRGPWFEDTARRVTQIQAVTRTLKRIHLDTRGTNLFCAPESLPSHAEVGSHSLTEDVSSDAMDKPPRSMSARGSSSVSTSDRRPARMLAPLQGRPGVFTRTTPPHPLIPKR